MREPQRQANLLKVHQSVGRYNHHVVPVVSENDHGLGDLPGGQVLRRGDLAGGVSKGMNGMRVFGVVLIEEYAQSL